MLEDNSSLLRDYLQVFSNIQVGNWKAMLQVSINLYDVLLLQYDYAYENKLIHQQVRICEIAKNLCNALHRDFQYVDNDDDKNRWLDVYRKSFSLSARRDLRQFALYMESGRKKKVWDKTADTMASVFNYGSKFINEEEFKMLRVSCMPGLGKSYVGNLMVANALGNDPNLSILRITFSEDLVEITTKQTKALMRTKEYRDVFPRYKDVSDDDMFKIDKNNMFVLCDCEDETQFNAVTRDGQATGKRAKWVLIDDILKGEKESNNINLQQSLIDRYDSDWSSRADDDKQKTLLLGTMWANLDLLNVLYDRASDDGDLVEDDKFKFTEVQVKNNQVISCFIGIPALYEEESTCPKRFSTEMLIKKRKTMSQYLWSAVYMQNPIAPDGLEFTWSQLRTYECLPTDTPISVYASLDPARRGKNYVSMPIFAKYKEDDDWYLIDFMYQKKSMKELYDVIVDRCITHKIDRLVVENNTDTSLKFMLEDRMKARHYFSTNIDEIYSYQNKEQRIKDNQGDVRNRLVFPRKGLYSESTEIGQAMQSITSYSFSYPNKFDDAIDSAVLFIQKYIDNTIAIASVGVFDRDYYGI